MATRELGQDTRRKKFEGGIYFGGMRRAFKAAALLGNVVSARKLQTRSLLLRRLSTWPQLQTLRVFPTDPCDRQSSTRQRDLHARKPLHTAGTCAYTLRALASSPLLSSPFSFSGTPSGQKQHFALSYFSTISNIDPLPSSSYSPRPCIAYSRIRTAPSHHALKVRRNPSNTSPQQ